MSSVKKSPTKKQISSHKEETPKNKNSIPISKIENELENSKINDNNIDDLDINNIFCKDCTFQSIGVCDELCEIITDKIGYKYPTKIQKETLPYALQNKDIIGLAETGSGKTFAYGIPIIQKLLEEPSHYFFACILAPTRELCLQINNHLEILGSGIGLKTCVLVGGLDLTSQAISLSKKPHIVIGTPGRVADHLANTKGFNLKHLKFLCFDEADRLLDLDFERQINQILAEIPKDRVTFLFSATMTSKVQKLQKASLKDPVKIEINTKYTTVDSLIQNYIFIPEKYKETYLAYILNQHIGKKIIIFVEKVLDSMLITFILRYLGFKSISINGKMTQSNRIAALNKFKSGEVGILVGTDVASRGLDIPNVDLVINYDLPQQTKDYIHRVGRTARAGKSGRAISFVTQYDVENIQQIEHLIEKKMEEYVTDEKKVMSLYEKVLEGVRDAKNELKDLVKKMKTKDKFDTKADRDDDEGEVYEQFLKNKRRNESSLVRNKSFVKKKKIK